MILDNIELISPDNDTIFVGERLACRFNRFPFHDSGLHFDRVLLRNARYHLATYRDADGKPGINLNYIINYFATDREPSPEPPKPFEVDVKELRLRNVDYIQDLPESPHYKHYDHGVVIPHMRFLGTNGVLRRVRVINDSVTVRIVAFSTTEQSGMHVEDLSADIVVSRHGIHATNLDLQTGHSRIFMDAHLVYHGWEEMSDYCNTVEHDVVLKEGTEVNICEASYWAPMLWGMDCLLRPRGHVYGTIADMQAEQMMVDFGQESRLFVDAHVTGLPMIEKTRMDVDIHRLHTTYDDLAAVKHPEPIKMQAPDLVRDLSPIDLEASLHGGASNCLVEFGLNSTVGDLEGNANVRFDSTVNNYAYRGEVTSRGLVLSKLMPNDWVTRSGFHMTMEGRGLRLEDMELTMDGRLYDTWFKGKQIDRTVLSAEMKEGVMLADLQLNDSLIKLDLTASADLKDSSLTARQAAIVGLGILAAVLAAALVLGAIVLMRYMYSNRKQKKTIKLLNENNALKAKFISSISAQLAPTLQKLDKGTPEVKALLDFSEHIQTLSELENAAEETVEKEDVQVGTLCEGLMEQIQGKVKSGVNLKVDAPKMAAHINKEYVSHILLHLLKNAAQYTPEDGHITLEYKKRGAHKHQFLVSNTGSSIPEEQREEVFKPFREVRDLTTGDGLGLPICKRMALNMNGDLDIDPAFTKGVRFVLHLQDD